ncbi:MAG: glutathione S-transferase family protein [Hyphomonas sp.]
MSKVVLHQLEISPFCDKVRRALIYKDIAFETINVPMAKLSALKKISPIGKVPVLEMDGEVLADSSLICQAIEKKIPTPSLYPDNKRDLAFAHILEDWADESLYFFEMTMRFTWTEDRARWVTELLKYDNALMRKLARPMVPGLTRKQGEAQGIAKKPDAMITEELREHINAISGILEGAGDYLVGGGLSIADISVVSQLECIAGSRVGDEVLNSFPLVMKWMARVEQQTGGPAIR